MKQNQIRGVVAIACGVLLVIPFFLAYMTVMGFNSGSYMKIVFDGAEVRDFTGFCCFLGFLSLICAVGLIIYGSLLTGNVGKSNKNTTYLVIPIVFGAIATFAGLLAMIDVGDMGVVKPGAGPILYFVFGLLTIGATIAIKFLVKETGAAAPKQPKAPKK